MKRISLDIETDGFDPSHIWCVGTEDIDTGESHLFTEDQRFQFKEYMKDATEVLGFNVLQFDLPILDRLWCYHVSLDTVTDVLLLCQLEQPGREGGNSLNSWGGRLRFPKMDMDVEDFYRGFSPEMGAYCMNDVKLTTKEITSRQERDGFHIDEFTAMSLSAEFSEKLTEIIDRMQAIFPPKEVQLKTKVKYIPFNPGSRKQIAERLMEQGWKPHKTKGYTDKGSVNSKGY